MSTPTENVRTLPGDLEFLTPHCPICGDYTDVYPDGLQCDRCGIAWDSDGTNPERLDPDAKQCSSLYRPTRRCANPEHVDVEYRCWQDAGHLGDDHHNPDLFYSWTTAEQVAPAGVER
ncbi:hypothetical protein Caci_3008 [Catenulispora acidiphila DSM 44928]|uniref:Uncharacterized protein n=1 Tax=Catenulispora acidiphila (strain DSM 44928 / JCM 14897 / NBRC 102108 / NRRL B-24433 / ID139908) TaxID=479433 RepID=C7Q4E8_CATAD|nr:hypothetical protein [Catenulispora acidiphila]ACU71917.1 hypothetical protein Caci_3008 [Catenulispora acidiphila DSM 44928]